MDCIDVREVATILRVPVSPVRYWASARRTHPPSRWRSIGAGQCPMSWPTSRHSGQRLVIEKRKRASGAITYRTQYYGPDRQPRSRSFSTRRDAAALRAQVKAEHSRGDWIDPRRGKISLKR